MYIIDCSKMTTRKDAFEELKRGLEAPDYMGANLDALHDVLGETRGEVRLVHVCKMLNALKGYGCNMLKVFFDAAEENEALTVLLGHGQE